MDKNKARTKEIGDAEAVSATEMTGLITTFPEDETEEENYFELLHYKASKKKRTEK